MPTLLQVFGLLLVEPVRNDVRSITVNGFEKLKIKI